MLENPTPTLPASDAPVKRYAPPNQRNRNLHRRKSSDRFDRANNLYGNDVEKNQVAAPRNVPIIDHGDSVSSNLLNVNPRSRLIALEGCYSSEASQLLNDRWAAAMHCYSNPSIDLSERPVMYAAPAWVQGQFTPQGRVDFLGELRRAVRNANASFST
ncbi:uncharacterized protein LOC132190112 [Corylus avellana]|uniref:uncharacterized protein LOC132190112 n=1 Tax=Corylus avellana TaxID=13451 RepID=UPI00286B48C5|nr:uncharacterized protein LOC132190112 [Corylus avellana]